MIMYVLLIENNALAQTESLVPCLEKQGYNVCVAYAPDAAITKIRGCWPNVVVINSIDIPVGVSTFQDVINETNLNIPYVVVGNKKDLPVSLDVDTILVAPDKTEQLIQAINRIEAQQQDRFIRLSDLVLDCHQYQVLRNAESYRLTPKEFKLLHLLIDNPDQVLSRKAIMQHVWETDYLGDTRTLDVHIRWIREKIEDNPSQPRHLITVRGVGYYFITEPE